MTPANEAALDAFIKLIAEKGFADAVGWYRRRGWL